MSGRIVRSRHSEAMYRVVCEDGGWWILRSLRSERKLLAVTPEELREHWEVVE